MAASFDKLDMPTRDLTHVRVGFAFDAKSDFATTGIWVIKTALSCDPLGTRFSDLATMIEDASTTDAIDVAASSFFRAYVHTKQTLETTLSGLLWIHGYGKGIVRTVGPTRVRLHGV